MKKYDNGNLALSGMLAGEADLSTVSEYPIVLNSFLRDDFSIISTITSSFKDIKVIVHRGRGIENEGDLKGKKIGIVPGTAAQFFLDSYLNVLGLLSSDVRIINMTTVERSKALKSGIVDAVVTTEPYAFDIVCFLPDDAKRLPTTEVYRMTYHLAGMRDFIKKHPETMIKIVRGLDRGVSYIRENKKECVGIMARILKMDVSYLEAIWDDYDFDLSLDQSLFISLEDEARWAIKNRLTGNKRVPNYLDFIYLDALNKVKPENMTIIQ